MFIKTFNFKLIFPFGEVNSVYYYNLKNPNNKADIILFPFKLVILACNQNLTLNRQKREILFHLNYLL